MKKFLSMFNLGDKYDIQAKILPASIVVLPLSIIALQFDLKSGSVLGAIGLGVGLEAVLAILFSFVARALGNQYQLKYEKKMNGLPTSRWLRKDNKEHSEQQKQKWISYLEKVSGLNLKNGAESDNIEERNILIEDAIANCRGKLRGKPEGEFLLTQNIWYGSARNLAGMRGLVFIVTLLCFITSILGVIYLGFSIGITIILGIFLLITAVYLFISDFHVSHCAKRYAEEFYIAIERYYEKRRNDGIRN